MTLKKVLRNPVSSFRRFFRRSYLRFLSFRCFSDKTSIKLKYRFIFRKKLDLSNPITFNEKLNWLKLYYRNDVLTKMVDKYEVKKIVSDLIGKEYVIPCLGIFDSWEEIDFNAFEAPFVIKTTHSSGVVFVIRDKAKANWKEIEKVIKKSLKRNYFYRQREWPYKNVRPRIIIEKMIKDSKEQNLPVFKFFCFSGQPFLVQTIKNDKTSYETIDYFDMNWNRLDLKQNFENSDLPLDRPLNFDKMKEIVKKLSGNHPFIRVDLYSVNGAIFFSEFTFFSDAGFTKFYPDKWDIILGEKIILPTDGTNC